MQKKTVSRRAFIKSGIAASVALGIPTIVPSTVFGANAPSNKLNIAVIGVGGRGQANIGGVRGENIVALCDVNQKNLDKAAAQFPKARTYIDWRKCLEQKDLDAVICTTTDHTHAHVNVWAMNRGLHVYCEKPLANSVHEARVVRETYLKNKDKLATQMGTQIHATENYRRVVEMVRHGAIGTPQKAQVWCSRMPKGGNYLPEVKPIPDHIHWDLWIGPSPYHPYNPEYFSGEPGANCLQWNYFWDFGSGQIGDMGSHLMDLAYWALDLRFPTSCQAKGTPHSNDTCPQWLIADWEHPANDWRPAVKVEWHDGGKKPGLPSELFNRDKMFAGAIFTGEKGWLVADYSRRILMLKGDMTHYKSPRQEDLIPPSPGQHAEWIVGCKTGKPTLCNFDYSGALIEHNLLALVAYRVGKKLDWDAKNLKATNCPQVDQYIRKTYRKGWILNG
jgi:predicted dehydrogenase